MKRSEPPIIVEQSFNIPIEKVWNAITVRDEMVQWYFDNIPAFKAEVGFKTNFLIENDGRQFPHYWEIMEVIPNQLITYRWTFSNYPGIGDVSFELFEKDTETLLRLTSVTIEDFRDDIPEFERESGVSGWTYFIQGQLKKYLDSQ